MKRLSSCLIDSKKKKKVIQHDVSELQSYQKNQMEYYQKVYFEKISKKHMSKFNFVLIRFENSQHNYY